MRLTNIRVMTALAAVGLLLAPQALADRANTTYEITVTNLTKGQTFTPILTAIHRGDVALFEVGGEASAGLGTLAEGGDTSLLTEELEDLGERSVGAVATEPGLLGPGETRTFRIAAHRNFRHLSMAAMLIPTNDTFFALNNVRLPHFRDASYSAPAYDAGTEENDQNCANIPGPVCGGAGGSAPAPGDEGFIGIGNGMHDLGSDDGQGNAILAPLTYDWRNPVAHVTVERVR
jgi:hypothetical protein